jgi:hypothetical protein
LEALKRSPFIVPGSAICTQQLTRNVLPCAGIEHLIRGNCIQWRPWVWESGFMNVLNIGRRYGLFGWRQAAELTSFAKHLRQAAFKSTNNWLRPLPNTFGPRPNGRAESDSVEAFSFLGRAHNLKPVEHAENQ